MTHRVDWDDLRFVLAVADQGSVAAAARRLGVNHTTVLRRVHAFEESRKIRLFERLPTGYVLTAEGEQLVAAARSIDDTVTSLERRIAGRDLKLEGSIRVTTTDTFMTSVLPRHLASFRRRHPRIMIELALTNSRLNLTKRDADVAIRPAKALPAPLVGTRIAEIGFALYGARTYLERHPEDLLSPDHAWLAGDDLLANSPVANWMRHHVPDARIAFRADSFVALFQAARAALGLAVLPCCLADADPALARLEAPLDDVTTGLWVLTHQDLRRAARIRAFVEHMETALAGEREILAGKPSPGTGLASPQSRVISVQQQLETDADTLPMTSTSTEAVDRLLAVMAALRDPKTGCPWDIEQTFETIAPYTIEEAYEVADAIARGDMRDLKEELGDLLLQVVYHAQMASESDADIGFTFDDVAAAIADKMIRRHPHVFGDASVDSAAAQTRAWEDVKAAERRAKGKAERESLLDDVPLALPALTRAEKLQKRAARGGFDWPDTCQVLDKLDEELGELKAEIAGNADTDRIEDELGDVLFTIANLARHLKIDPEEALRRTNRKFEQRFRAVERALEQDGRVMTATPLDDLEALWQAAKGVERS